MGSFDYHETKGKQQLLPIRLTNKFKVYTDKLWRPVNTFGYLINEKEDIIDNEGRVVFTFDQLRQQGALPFLYTYKGEQFKITDIIGMFRKDDQSKDIILEENADKKTVDMLGRLVNATGYLIDDAGNIVKYVDKERKIMFYFWEILFQEPPKLFEFTEFDIRWI